MRRAAVAAPANIAEGFKKRGRLDKAGFMTLLKHHLRSAAFTSSWRETSLMARTTSCLGWLKMWLGSLQRPRATSDTGLLTPDF